MKPTGFDGHLDGLGITRGGVALEGDAGGKILPHRCTQFFEGEVGGTYSERMDEPRDDAQGVAAAIEPAAHEGGPSTRRVTDGGVRIVIDGRYTPQRAQACPQPWRQLLDVVRHLLAHRVVKSGEADPALSIGLLVELVKLPERGGYGLLEQEVKPSAHEPSRDLRVQWRRY